MDDLSTNCATNPIDAAGRSILGYMHKDAASAAVDILKRHGPVMTVAAMLSAGLSRWTLVALERRGDLVRVGKSALVSRSLLEASDPWERFRLRSLGFELSIGPDMFLTGWSAGVMRGIPALGDPPAYPLALRPGDAHRGTDTSPYGKVRTGALPEHDRTTLAGVRTVSLAYTAVEVARRGTAAEALVAMDFALHRGVTREALREIVELLRHYPGVSRASWALRHGDPRAESPLETLGRLAFIERGLRPPLSNVWVEDGFRAHRADHLDPGTGVVLEGDGAFKYDNRSDAHKILDARDDRDRWFRSHGYAIDHYTYAMARYDRPGLIQRYWTAARSRGDRPLPDNWSLERPAWL